MKFIIMNFLYYNRKFRRTSSKKTSMFDAVVKRDPEQVQRRVARRGYENRVAALIGVHEEAEASG